MAELTVTCRNCGRKSDPTEVFQCPHCGTDLPDPDAAPPARAPGTVLEPDIAGSPSLGVTVNGTRFTLDEGDTLLLGRDDDLPCEPALRDNLNVSRFHASLRLAGGRLYVTDMSSTNGTHIDGNRLPKDTEYEVPPNHSLRLGSNVPVELDWPDR